MGTLFNQPPRDQFGVDHKDILADILTELKNSAKKGYKFADGIQILELLEKGMKYYQIKQDYDVKNEQLARFRELMKDLISAISIAKEGE